MHRQAGNHAVDGCGITRRDVLQTGLATGLGLGTAALLEATSRPRIAAAAPVYGGHLTVLNVGYPEVWDPHMAGTLLALAAVGPLDNQVVEFNPPTPWRSLVTWPKAGGHGGWTGLRLQLHDHVKW